MEKCAICLQNIISDGISHEICSSNFHRDHLASWFILNNQNCPYCKYPFDKDIIQDLNPKTKDELERLKKIAEVFGAPREREIIPFKPRKTKPDRKIPRTITLTPMVVNRKWLVYWYRLLTMLPLIIVASFSLFLIIGSLLVDLTPPYKILIIPLSIMFLTTLAGIMTTYKEVGKKITYQAKMG